jgi:hypothetical protein
MIQDVVFFVVFILIWATFCKFAIYIYDKLCYIILAKEIDVANKKQQKQITKILIKGY